MKTKETLLPELMEQLRKIGWRFPALPPLYSPGTDMTEQEYREHIRHALGAVVSEASGEKIRAEEAVGTALWVIEGLLEIDRGWPSPVTWIVITDGEVTDFQMNSWEQPPTFNIIQARAPRSSTKTYSFVFRTLDLE